MSYFTKEIFYSLQGEGLHTGRAAVFCRFAGCNLWSGREADRAKAVCRFCDTDFIGAHDKFADAATLAAAVAEAWPENPAGGASPKNTAHSGPLVICTGGEPLLQLDSALISALHARGFAVAVETNGTLPLPEGLDWVCVSPKAGAEQVVRRGDELKLVFPQTGIDPAACEGWDFGYFWLQPMAGPQLAYNTRLALEYCLAHPRWRLSLQTHKVLDIP